jgi:hypothetical protein
MSETLDPTLVIIDGAESRMSRILVQAAAVRSDVEIDAVTGPIVPGEPKPVQIKAYEWLLNHDTVYGTNAVGVAYHPDRGWLLGMSPNAVTINLGRDAEATSQDFGDNGQLPEKLIVMHPTRWNPRTKDERLTMYIPGTSDPSDISGGGPLHVPEARYLAAMPFVQAFRGRLLSLIEARPPHEGDHVADFALGASAPSLSSSRAATGAIRETFSPDLTQTVTMPGAVAASYASVRENSVVWTVPVGVGSRAALKFGVVMQPGLDAREILSDSDVYDFGPDAEHDEISSSLDVRGSSKVLVPMIESRGNDVAGLSLQLLYDENWLRANAILDAAVQLNRARS